MSKQFKPKSWLIPETLFLLFFMFCNISGNWVNMKWFIGLTLLTVGAFGARIIPEDEETNEPSK